MKRLLITGMLLSALCSLFAGCGKQVSQIPDTAATETQTEICTETTGPVTAEDAMIGRSLASEGNNFRLQRVLEKMRRGESVTVGFIGGSITEGYNAMGVGCYAIRVARYLDETYSDGSGKVTFVNAGLSGMPSMLGLIRADRDLLEYGPDLIFIEFAVNDAQNFADKQAYEGLIRKCLLQENEPAVILLHSVTENGYTCQNEMALTAFYYDLPAVSVRDAIMPEIQEGTMKWSDWSDDDVHPHREGHLLYSRFIINLIDTLGQQSQDEAYTVPQDCRFSRNWSDMTQFDSTNLSVTDQGDFSLYGGHYHFKNGFSYRGDHPEDHRGITFTVTGNTLFLVYKATNLASYGTAEVLVNGEVVAHLSGSTPDGWNNPVAQLILSEKESAEYEVTVRMQPGDEGKYFDLLAVGTSQN